MVFEQVHGARGQRHDNDLGLKLEEYLVKVYHCAETVVPGIDGVR